MLASTVLLYALGKGLLGRQGYAMMAKATSTGGPRAVSRRRGLCFTALFSGITLLAILPHLGVVLVAFSSDWYATVVPHRYTLENFHLALGRSPIFDLVAGREAAVRDVERMVAEQAAPAVAALQSASRPSAMAYCPVL